MKPDTEDVAAFLAGFVAAEGCFSGTRDGRRFIFEVGLGATDGAMCELLQAFLGVGHVRTRQRRKPHYDDETTFAVQSVGDNLTATIRFMDTHLPISHKRRQYLNWRSRLLAHWQYVARRRRPCVNPDCEKCADIEDPAKGLIR